MARKIEFDRTQVLNKAMRLFWEKGYCKTSMADLVQTTDLKPGSLYAAFQSKEGLFLATLEHYAQCSVQTINQCLNNAKTPLQGIKDFLLLIINETRKGDEHMGCFLVNTVLETNSTDKVIKQAANSYFSDIEVIISNALLDAQKEGELAMQKNPIELAQFIMLSIWGLRVLAKTNPNEQKINTIEQQLFSCLF